MPQIDQIASIYASQLFWLAVVFALIYFGIGRGMVPRIQRTMEDRDRRIAGDLAAAEAARTAADRAEEGYRAALDRSRASANAETGAAKAEATRLAEAQVRAADVDIAQRTAHAEAALSAARLRALGEIEAVAVDAAQEIAQRVAGLSVDRAAAAAAVVDSMAHA